MVCYPSEEFIVLCDENHSKNLDLPYDEDLTSIKWQIPSVFLNSEWKKVMC